jgi:phosphoribosylglycinamide formyltransferase 1
VKNFAVFASGRGSNLGAIIEALKENKISARLALVVSDRPEARALELARTANIPTAVFDRQNFADRGSFEEAILARLREARIDFIVLAGYMRILSPQFVQAYRDQIINIHPSFLPAFKGAHAIADAFAAGIKETGVTVHFVDEEIDHGDVILQEKVAITPEDTLETLEEKIHKVEHRLYPKAIDLFARGQLK